MSIVIFTALFASIVGIITVVFVKLEYHVYGTILGLLALSIEATLAFPQLISNQRNRSVEGLSIIMIVTWFVGDFLKTIYFVVEVYPSLFIEPAIPIYFVGCYSADR